jgi:hypothetical protein
MALCEFLPLYEFPLNSCVLSNNVKKSNENIDDKLMTIKGSNASSTIPSAYQNRGQPSVMEWLIVGWIFTLLCEEARQVIQEFFSSFFS